MRVSSWPSAVSATQIPVYEAVLREAVRREIPVAIGGSLAMMAYASVERPSKDLDLYVMPKDRDRMVSVLNDLGFADYYGTARYDQGWIYRATTDDVIVDVIWQMANRRASVDEHWLSRGPDLVIGETTLRLVPVEELIWSKLFVLQRDRCDWPDIFNMIHAAADRIDWQWLLGRLESDAPLLTGVLQVYLWLCPASGDRLPAWLRRDLSVESRESVAAGNPRRADLLDSRPWLVAGCRGGEDAC